MFREDTETPVAFTLHPYATRCYVVIQKPQRSNAMTDTAEAFLYLLKAGYNHFSHTFVGALHAHIVLRRSGTRLQITGRVIFPYMKGDSDPSLDPATPTHTAPIIRWKRWRPAASRCLARSGFAGAYATATARALAYPAPLADRSLGASDRRHIAIGARLPCQPAAPLATYRRNRRQRHRREFKHAERRWPFRRLSVSLRTPALGRSSERTPPDKEFPSGTWALVLQKSRGCLRLVDISRTPSGTFFFRCTLSRKWLAKMAKS